VGAASGSSFLMSWNESCGDSHWFKRGSGSGSKLTKNLKKVTAEIKFIFFRSKIAIHLSLGPHKKDVQATGKVFNISVKETIQHFKTRIFFTFGGSFWPSWIRIQPTKYECGSGCATLPETRGWRARCSPGMSAALWNPSAACRRSGVA
jgi:hypothetical protein